MTITHEPTSEGWKLFRDEHWLIGILYNMHDTGSMTNNIRHRTLMLPESCAIHFTAPMLSVPLLKAVMDHIAQHNLVERDPSKG